jgi:MarR family transcriptional regulator, 2-MHQ and catechol-resistance regulon repressor
MTHRFTHRDRTQRAFRTCAVLIDTAEWMKTELRGPLAAFDITMRDFRLLELLYREGPLPVKDVGRRLDARRSVLTRIIARVSARGWIRQITTTLPPVAFERAHLHHALRKIPRRGRRIAVIGLTKTGKKFMKDVLPRHLKLVKALLRVLHIREQDSLVRICLKLRQGDILKFMHEIRMEDDE